MMRKLSMVDRALASGLQISPNGRFCAAFERRGSSGVVVDLQTGRETMPLHRGDYHTGVCQFSVAFFESQGKSLLVHATDWNRLDVSDPETGDLLTTRQSPESREANYLDYFHCGLSVSPDMEWIADNGWIWHPLGSIRTWRLTAWLRESEWESETGASLRTLCERPYHWDVADCWIDRATFAVWGLGGEFEDEGEAARPGVRIFNVASGKEIRSFPGVDLAPEWSAQASRTGWMTFDGLLFAVSPTNGTAAWNVETGEKLFHDPGFAPLRYHRGTREFFSVVADNEFLSSVFASE